MIQRREFLTSCATVCAFASWPKFVNAKDQFRTLNWRSVTIQTVAKTDGNRAPVVTGVSLRPNSTEIAIVGDDHFVSIYDQSTNRFTEHLGEHKDWVRAARYSPSGEQLVTAGNDRRLMIWDTERYDTPTLMSTHPEAIIEVAFNPDGSRLATAGFEESLRIYDTQSTQLVQKLEGACNDNHAVAFSVDGQLIAAGGRCGTIRVWEVPSGNMTAEFQAHRNRVRSIEFDSNGLILSCGEDQKVKLTNPQQPRTPVQVAKQSARLFDSKLIGGDLVATGSADNQIHIWKLTDLSHVGMLEGHTGTVCCLDVNETKMVSGSYDTQVRVWDLQTDEALGVRHTQLNQGWNGRLK